MNKQIFVNLPVADLQASIAFFTDLGFTFNAEFTDDTATCMVVADNIFVMLLTREKFQTFIPGRICDSQSDTEVLVCLSCESRQQVDDLVRKALAGGGVTFRDPEDHGFMYGHAFRDLDGHIWELVHMEGTP